MLLERRFSKAFTMKRNKQKNFVAKKKRKTQQVLIPILDCCLSREDEVMDAAHFEQFLQKRTKLVEKLIILVKILLLLKELRAQIAVSLEVLFP